MEDSFSGDGAGGDASGGNASDGVLWGAADEASLARPLLTSCCAARFLTGRGSGFGDPCYKVPSTQELSAIVSVGSRSHRWWERPYPDLLSSYCLYLKK